MPQLHKPVQQKILTLHQAAEFLGFNKETVRLYAASGEIPGAKLGGSWRFIEQDLVIYLRSLYSEHASQGCHNKRSKKLWHSTSEIKPTGLISDITEKEYNEALGLATR